MMDRHPPYDVVQRLPAPPLTLRRALRIALEFVVVAAAVIVAAILIGAAFHG